MLVREFADKYKLTDIKPEPIPTSP